LIIIAISKSQAAQVRIGVKVNLIVITIPKGQSVDGGIVVNLDILIVGSIQRDAARVCIRVKVNMAAVAIFHDRLHTCVAKNIYTLIVAVAERDRAGRRAVGKLHIFLTIATLHDAGCRGAQHIDLCGG